MYVYLYIYIHHISSYIHICMCCALSFTSCVHSLFYPRRFLFSFFTPLKLSWGLSRDEKMLLGKDISFGFMLNSGDVTTEYN